MSTSPSVAQIQHALQIAEEIQQLQNELSELLSKTESATKVQAGNFTAFSARARSTKPAATAKPQLPPSRGKSGVRRQLSPEAREKIAEAQRRRWANARAAKS